MSGVRFCAAFALISGWAAGCAGPQPPATTMIQPGVANLASGSLEARWADHGAYLQRMIEVVQAQWDRSLAESKVYPQAGSAVTVKFVLDSLGRVVRIVKVESPSGDLAARFCLAAITARPSYGKWTNEMKAALGEEQEMNFSFYFQ